MILILQLDKLKHTVSEVLKPKQGIWREAGPWPLSFDFHVFPNLMIENTRVNWINNVQEVTYCNFIFIVVLTVWGCCYCRRSRGRTQHGQSRIISPTLLQGKAALSLVFMDRSESVNIVEKGSMPRCFFFVFFFSSTCKKDKWSSGRWQCHPVLVLLGIINKVWKNWDRQAATPKCKDIH